MGKESRIRESFEPVMGNYLNKGVNRRVWDEWKEKTSNKEKGERR